MGVLSGSISYTLFHVEGDALDVTREEWLGRIAEFQFQPLLPDSEEDLSMGWVRVDDMLRWDFTKDAVFRDDYLLLTLRTDRWSLPAALLRATIQQRIDAFAVERGRVRLSRTERDTIRETVRREFKERMLPSAGAVDMVWNIARGELRFWSQSKGAKESFQELFEATFDCRIHENGPYMAARALPLTDDEIKALADIEYTDFVGE